MEPAEWNGSNVDQMGVKEKGLVTQQGGDDNKYLQLKNIFVGKLGIGSTAPGFINLGTPWVYATFPKIENSDGGTFGDNLLHISRMR